MNDCVFCKIVAGDLPCYKIHENDRFIAFLDIFPKTKGHTLVIPKKHYRWVNDVPEFTQYWEESYLVSQMLQKSLSPEWIQYLTFGEIPHAHIHVIPRFDVLVTGKTDILPSQSSTAKEKLEETAEKILNLTTQS